MKKIAQVFSVVLLIAMLFCFCSCNITITDKRTETEKVDEDKDDDGKSLKLLSFETVKEEAELKLPESEQFMLLAETVNESESALENLPENFEATSDTHQKVRATIRNVERDSFIDLVLYFSWLNTQVVYNEGNGEYQCKSTTKFDNENQVWVTVIDLELDVEFDEEFTAMVEVKEINFLHNGDQKVHAELNSTAVRTIEYCMIFTVDKNSVLNDGNIYFKIKNDTAIAVYFSLEIWTTDQLIFPNTVSYVDFLGNHTLNVTEFNTGSWGDLTIKNIVLPTDLEIINSLPTGIEHLEMYNKVTTISVPLTYGLQNGSTVNVIYHGTEAEWNTLLENNPNCVPDNIILDVTFVPANNNEE